MRVFTFIAEIIQRMDDVELNKTAVRENGFTILDGIFSDAEVGSLMARINNVETDKPTFSQNR